MTPSEVLAEVFGYEGFRPLQLEIIEAVIAGENALALMPTGGGKSICYQAPAIVRPGCDVVVSPLIPLMQDQVETLKGLGVRAEFLNSTVDYDEVLAIEQSFRPGNLDLL